MENSKIVLGKEYMTRDGYKVKLLYVGNEGRYPVFGFIYKNNGYIVNSMWTTEGTYSIPHVGNNCDLVEVEQEEPQEVEVPKKEVMEISKNNSYTTANGLEVRILSVPEDRRYHVRGEYKSAETGLWTNTIWRCDGRYRTTSTGSHPLDLVEVCNYKPAVETQVKKITTDKEYTSNGQEVGVSNRWLRQLL